MISKKEVVVIWSMFFLLMGAVIYVSESGASITGNIPLTGILKEEVGAGFVPQIVDMNLEIKDDSIYKLRDLAFSIEFIPESNIQTKLDISYFILNQNREIIYFNEDSITINDRFLFVRDLDDRRAQEIELEEGEFTLGIRVTYLDDEKSFSSDFKIKKISKLLYSLKQLFDIKLELESYALSDADELEARVIFENFGTEVTPINLTFFVYDRNDNEIYRSEQSTIVYTEDVVFESFSGIDIEPGKYKVILRTLYNVGVEDYFEAEFELKEKIDIFPMIVLVLLLVAGGYFIVRHKSRKYK